MVARIKRALKGWARRAPAQSRAPPPWPAVMAIVGMLVLFQKPVEALCLLVHTLCYLRPGEATSLMTSHLVPGLPVAGRVGVMWALLLHPTEGVKTSKTGEHDESMLLDSAGFEWMAQPLQELLARRPRDGPLWPFSHDEYVEALHMAIKTLGLEAFINAVYAFRHAGASHDLLLGKRTFQEVKDRGRWRSDMSMKRYAKPAQSLEQLGALPLSVVDFGTEVELHLHQIFQENTAMLASLNQKRLAKQQNDVALSTLPEAEQRRPLKLVA